MQQLEKNLTCLLNASYDIQKVIFSYLGSEILCFNNRKFVHLKYNGYNVMMTPKQIMHLINNFKSVIFIGLWINILHSEFGIFRKIFNYIKMNRLLQLRLTFTDDRSIEQKQYADSMLYSGKQFSIFKSLIEPINTSLFRNLQNRHKIFNTLIQSDVLELFNDLGMEEDCHLLYNLNDFNYKNEQYSKEINIFAMLTQLRTLNLHGYKKITNIDTLQNCRNLINLNLCNTNVCFVDVLQHCKKLEKLNISHTLVTNIDVLKHCKKLVLLNLYATSVSNILVLCNCPYLEVLHLNDFVNTDNLYEVYTTYTKSPRLKRLYLNKIITNINKLESFLHLQYIDGSMCKLHNIVRLPPDLLFLKLRSWKPSKKMIAYIEKYKQTHPNFVIEFKEFKTNNVAITVCAY
jgi:hypothetical protein